MATTKWALDTTHSDLQFKIKHLMISTVTGTFAKLEANVETAGDDLATAKVSFTADVKSISTNNEQRDAHLQNGDFFETDKYPTITFKGTRLEKIDEENFKLHGQLTMKGVSKDITLNVEYGGLIPQDPWGHTRMGFEVNGKINRKDWGLSYGALSETGNVMLGEEVKIHANVEFVKVGVPAEATA